MYEKMNFNLIEKRSLSLLFSVLLAYFLLPIELRAADNKTEIVLPEGEYDGIEVSQPIDFPHNIHVRENKINCLYCHTYARRSKVAGIPPTSKCIGCHKIIATDKPRIQKLQEFWDKGVSPPWKKVHDLPDFVHFTHEVHLKKFIFDPDLPIQKAGEVCGVCHGDLANMTTARKVKPLTMGWCVECHEKNGGPGDCWACHK
ncbi:MAG: cytochrome c3 family protein [Gammaproteobacteria bacterium]|nr:cytochrome c3 family protein [Gammaproteobacteria bacterium]